MHMTWTAAKFMSSLPRPSIILEVPENYYMSGGPHYLPYVPMFMESLAEQ
jgi:hypothetical protein